MFSLPVYLVPVIPEGGDSYEDCDCVSRTSHPAFLLLEMWEKAIKLSKELAETYESKVFDYEGLGSLLVSLGQWGCSSMDASKNSLVYGLQTLLDFKMKVVWSQKLLPLFSLWLPPEVPGDWERRLPWRH